MEENKYIEKFLFDNDIYYHLFARHTARYIQNRCCILLFENRPDRQEMHALSRHPTGSGDAPTRAPGRTLAGVGDAFLCICYAGVLQVAKMRRQPS
jgi:hypothetical protein